MNKYVIILNFRKHFKILPQYVHEKLKETIITRQQKYNIKNYYEIISRDAQIKIKYKLISNNIFIIDINNKININIKI